MLADIGVASLDRLIDDAIPPALQLKRPLALPPGSSELELRREFGAMAAANAHAGTHVSFLGGGIYERYIPAALPHLLFRSEFYTAYTPYQAEVAQGTLMAIFEFQTIMCELTGLPVANASLYDGGTACAEAALLSRGVNGRGLVLASPGIHPHHRQIIETYGRSAGLKVELLPEKDGVTDVTRLDPAALSKACCVLVPQPNVYGLVEPLEEIFAAARGTGALKVAVVDPVMANVLRSAGDCGADLAVGEAQALGVGQNLGGPVVGFMASTMEHVRRLPGRIAGVTRDTRGRRGFVLTLQTREQHIRRARATSNICTNETLIATAATIYCCLLGRTGLREVAEHSAHKAHYAAERAAASGAARLRYPGPFVQEFVLTTQAPADALVADALADGVLAGIPLSRWDATRTHELLVAVTETRTREDIDRWASGLAKWGRGRP
ncbi:MAG: aminomethyl-transferring glycine dehydrogenase subunit GcvPA [Candidatus Eisenbacteria bacterium]|nr:aminomethyl-transferring glycine dehydrogenase subunit GcvPA [Candidatus Eisenbacteria bacterium]